MLKEAEQLRREAESIRTASTSKQREAQEKEKRLEEEAEQLRLEKYQTEQLLATLERKNEHTDVLIDGKAEELTQKAVAAFRKKELAWLLILAGYGCFMTLLRGAASEAFRSHVKAFFVKTDLLFDFFTEKPFLGLTRLCSLIPNGTAARAAGYAFGLLAVAATFLVLLSGITGLLWYFWHYQRGKLAAGFALFSAGACVYLAEVCSINTLLLWLLLQVALIALRRALLFKVDGKPIKEHIWAKIVDLKPSRA